VTGDSSRREALCLASAEHIRHEIEEFREMKDRYFETAHDSPIPHEERHRFKGLKYYPVDLKYRFRVKLNRFERPERVTMGTSTGETRSLLRAGYFESDVDGVTVSANAYKSGGLQDHSLFIPFRDKTSGKETYGAGRYIDLEEQPGDIYDLDFNLAYSPSCAYNPNYSCPLPPVENWLGVEIKAGEKTYHEE